MNQTVTDNTTLSVPEDIRLIHNVMATTMCIVGFILNFIIVLDIIRYKLYLRTVIVFTLNLSAICCISSGLSLAYISYNSFTVYTDKPWNDITCKAIGFISFWAGGTELLALVLISVNRYCLIVKHHKYFQIYGRRKNILFMFCLSWSIYFILFLLPAAEVWGKMLYDKNRLICQPFLYGDSFSKFITYFSIGTTLPTLMFCYLQIIWKVNSSRRNINRASNKKRPIKMPYMIISILTTFVFLYLPYLFVQVTDPHEVKYDTRIHIATSYIAWIRLFLNPILYAIFNNHINETLKKLFCIKTKNSISVFSEQNQIDLQITVNTQSN